MKKPALSFAALLCRCRSAWPVRGLSVALVALSSLAAGCKAAPPPDPYLENCTAYLEALLNAPSTLRVLDLQVAPGTDGGPRVEITYDAANAFGTPVRGDFRCYYLTWELHSKELGWPPDTVPKPELLSVNRIVSDGEELDQVAVTLTGVDALKILKMKKSPQQR